jgi:cAMP-dependent protein kinase regulator
MHLKIEDLKSRLKNNADAHTETESSAEEESEEEVVPLKKEASKKQRAGVSAEVFGQHNKKEDFVLKVVVKTPETKTKLTNRLLQAFMFNALEVKELNIVIDAIEEVKVSSGENVIVQGEQGDCMYVLESGSLDCTKIFPGKSEPTFLKTYQPGEGFGELALLYNCPRAATITAKSNSVVWRLDRDTFNNIVKDAA